jgi:hypothetical protein
MGKEVSGKRKRNIIFISLFIIALALLAVSIIKEVNRPRMSPNEPFGPPCMNSRFTLEPVCYDNKTNEVRIGVFRDSEDFTPIGIKLTFSTIKGDIEFYINKTSNNSYIRMSDSVYGESLEIPGMESKVEYIVKLMDTESINEVAIAAIIKEGKSNKICDITERVTNISSC